MSLDVPTAALVPPHAPRTLKVQPSWLGALHGIWLLTWKSNLTLRRLPALALALLLLPLLTYFTLSPEDSQAYLHWSIDFYLMLLLPLYCLFVCGGLVRDELQSDTLGFLLTRPLTRARLFLAKFICHIAWLQGIALVNGLLLILAAYLRQVPDLDAFPLVFLGTQFLAVLTYGALSALLGLIHQRYMVLGIIYGFVVELGIGKIPTNINSLSMSHHIQTILGNTKVINENYGWQSEGWLSSIGIMCLATCLFLSAAAVLFTFREYHHSEEMQK